MDQQVLYLNAGSTGRARVVLPRARECRPVVPGTVESAHVE